MKKKRMVTLALLICLSGCGYRVIADTKYQLMYKQAHANGVKYGCVAIIHDMIASTNDLATQEQYLSQYDKCEDLWAEAIRSSVGDSL